VLPETPLGQIFAVIRKGRVRINGRKVAGGYRIVDGDELQIDESLLDSGDRHGTNGQHSPAPRGGSELRHYVILENEHLLAINKPRGIAVHGPDGLDQQVRNYLGDSLPHSLSFRPGPVHRIDRNTTGIVFFGKSALGARRLSEYLRNGSARKVYLAVFDRELRTPVVWEDRLRRDTQKRRTHLASGRSRGNAHARGNAHGRTQKAGQTAITGICPILWSNDATLALCTIRTGRTHQIRAQAAIHDFPLLGDRKYGGRADRGGYVLHAMVFVLPEEDETLGFRYVYADPPSSVLEGLNRRFGPLTPERILESVNRAMETV